MAQLFGGSGGQTTTSQTTPTAAQLPPELQPLLSQTAGNIASFQRAFPLGSLMQNLSQPVTPLTGPELTMLGRQVGQANAPSITFPELGALTDIGQLTGGPIGSSPATLAGMKAFEQLERPGIEQDLALAGLSHGGAFPEVINQARTAATLPLIQEEIQNRLKVLPSLQMLGSSLAGRERGDTATALQAAGMPRQIADAINQAQWQDMMRKANLVQGANLGVFSQLAPMVAPAVGSSGTTTVTPQMPNAGQQATSLATLALLAYLMA